MGMHWICKFKHQIRVLKKIFEMLIMQQLLAAHHLLASHVTACTIVLCVDIFRYLILVCSGVDEYVPARVDKTSL